MTYEAYKDLYWDYLNADDQNGSISLEDFVGDQFQAHENMNDQDLLQSPYLDVFFFYDTETGSYFSYSLDEVLNNFEYHRPAILDSFKRGNPSVATSNETQPTTEPSSPATYNDDQVFDDYRYNEVDLFLSDPALTNSLPSLGKFMATNFLRSIREKSGVEQTNEPVIEHNATQVIFPDDIASTSEAVLTSNPIPMDGVFSIGFGDRDHQPGQPYGHLRIETADHGQLSRFQFQGFNLDESVIHDINSRLEGELSYYSIGSDVRIFVAENSSVQNTPEEIAQAFIAAGILEADGYTAGYRGDYGPDSWPKDHEALEKALTEVANAEAISRSNGSKISAITEKMRENSADITEADKNPAEPVLQTKSPLFLGA